MTETQSPLTNDAGAPPPPVVDPGTAAPAPTVIPAAVPANEQAVDMPEESTTDLPEPAVPGAPQVAAPLPPIATAPPPAPPAVVTLAPVPTAASEHAANVDANALDTLIRQLRPAFVAAVADTVKVAQAAVSRAADFYVPLIAQAALMRTNPDPAIQAAADRQLRHLRGQSLMNVATLGIPLQQRQEQAFIRVMETLVSAGIAALGGGVPAAIPLIEKLGAAALGAFKQGNA